MSAFGNIIFSEKAFFTDESVDLRGFALSIEQYDEEYFASVNITDGHSCIHMDYHVSDAKSAAAAIDQLRGIKHALSSAIYQLKEIEKQFAATEITVESAELEK